MKNNIFVSVIVAIYKDTESLSLILESLYNQSYKGNYEVIVAEDGEDTNVKNFISNLKYKNLIHTSQKDEGWRKNKSLNNAIRNSNGELLIFLDGDCIPYSNLIENYVKLKEEKAVLCGRRVELGEVFAKQLRKKELTINELENSYIKNYFKLIKDNTRHYEEGIKFNEFFYKLKYKNKKSHIIGCNFAINKEDIYRINGFDEDYFWPSVGEDTDIEHRLLNSGIRMKPARNLCNTVHLYHKITYSGESYNNSYTYFKKHNENKIKCINGLDKVI